MLLGRRVIGEMLLERIPIDEVPEDPAKAALWLHENYHHKVQQSDLNSVDISTNPFFLQSNPSSIQSYRSFLSNSNEFFLQSTAGSND